MRRQTKNAAKQPWNFIKFIALAFLLLFIPEYSAKAVTALDPTSADSFFALNDLGYAGVPIIGYDDKSGWLYGGAGFIYSDNEPGINAGLFAVSNFNDFYSSTLNYEQRKSNWLLAFHGLAERSFDNYYGEGDLTSTNNPYVISMEHFESKPTLMYRFVPHFRVGFFDDYRSRVETGSVRSGISESGDLRRLFPDENTNAIGMHVEWDTRDKIINTRKGNFLQLNVTYGSPAWTSWPGAIGFTQFQMDLRRFLTLYRHVTLGSRLVGALSEGAPTYLFRYRLGGLDTMRGYEDNRFRGKNFCVIQEEIRWYIIKWLSVNISTDLGDIGDDSFHQAKLTEQVGIRLGLPPDWVQKMRIDLGYGFDQNTFQIQFGEIF
jgi:outer membrane protein assembly factor BamA